MEKVRPWCGQPSDRGRLRNRTDKYDICQLIVKKSKLKLTVAVCHNFHHFSNGRYLGLLCVINCVLSITWHMFFASKVLLVHCMYPRYRQLIY